MNLLRRTISFFAVALALASACSKEVKVIPEDDMTMILADMFLASEWTQGNTDIVKQLDTTLFYEPVFRNYGYTFSDYDNSVRFYSSKPEKFSSILGKAASMLEEIADNLEFLNDRNENWKAFVADSTYRLCVLNQYKSYYDARRDSLWANQKSETGKFLRHKSASGKRKDMQL